MKKYYWYRRQKVTAEQLRNAYDAVDTAIKNIPADSFMPGWAVAPNITQHDPTPNMSVDVDVDSAAAIGYDKNGERLYIGTTQVVSLSAITLPGAGLQKYVTVLAGYARSEDELTVTPLDGTIYFEQDDGVEFTIIQGTAASTGTAVRPPHPGDERLILADILISEATTSITNGLIDQTRRQSLALSSKVQGFAGDITLGANTVLGHTTPTAAQATNAYFNRGIRPKAGIRLLEGATPATDAPSLQFTNFTDSSNYSWENLATQQEAGGWRDDTTHLRPSTATRPIKWGNTSAPHASAYIEAVTTTKGFAGIPSMTTIQRDAIATPKTGLLIFNNETTTYQFYTGSVWLDLGVGSGAGGEITVPDYVTITTAMLADEYYDLNFVPANASSVRVHYIDGPTKKYGTDFTVITDGSYVRRVSFGPSMLSELADGDEVLFLYTVGNPSVIPLPAENVGADETGWTGFLADVAADPSTQDVFDFIDANGFNMLRNEAWLSPGHPNAADDGNLGTPFLTLQAALNALDDLGKIYVDADDFYEDPTVISKSVTIFGLRDYKDSEIQKTRFMDTAFTFGGASQIDVIFERISFGGTSSIAIDDRISTMIFKESSCPVFTYDGTHVHGHNLRFYDSSVSGFPSGDYFDENLTAERCTIAGNFVFGGSGGLMTFKDCSIGTTNFYDNGTGSGILFDHCDLNSITLHGALTVGINSSVVNNKLIGDSSGSFNNTMNIYNTTFNVPAASTNIIERGHVSNVVTVNKYGNFALPTKATTYGAGVTTNSLTAV